MKYTFRTLGYDAPEMKPLLSTPNRDKHKEMAIKTRNFFSDLVKDKIVKLKCGKFDKYGRILVTVYSQGKCINDIMLQSGLVLPYDGKTKLEFNF